MLCALRGCFLCDITLWCVSSVMLEAADDVLMERSCGRLVDAITGGEPTPIIKHQ